MMKKRSWFAMGLFLAAIVAADQITKALVRAKIPYGTGVQLLPGVVQLTYVRNAGAAFSMLRGGRWLFLALVVVFFAVVALLIRRKALQKPAELWALAAVGGGALGNAIDRAVCGEVTDMIEPLFMQFAVFNVADIFISCGAIFLVVYILFFDREKQETRGGYEHRG
ncbi:MAG: signal peptidase II [Oscillospiraceae bacterium]|nr:signal peptidase II [Oscillospiraceae bacterium]